MVAFMRMLWILEELLSDLLAKQLAAIHDEASSR
jgi:hypothetical protein